MYDKTFSPAEHHICHEKHSTVAHHDTTSYIQQHRERRMQHDTPLWRYPPPIVNLLQSTWLPLCIFYIFSDSLYYSTRKPRIMYYSENKNTNGFSLPSQES